MKLLGRRSTEAEHEEVEQRLNRHDRQLSEMARRLRRLEIEAGIVKPPLKGVDHSRVA